MGRARRFGAPFVLFLVRLNSFHNLADTPRFAGIEGAPDQNA
jgi:hypothetical protein